MSTIGFIGSGNIGATVARLAVLAGHDVVLSNSREASTLWPLAAALGPQARAATREEAAQADLVVLTVPFFRTQDVPAELLDGKVVIDTGNYYPERDGTIASLEDGTATTTGIVQEHLAGAQVVKGFNNIWFHHLGLLARPSGAPDRSALAIAGDHPAATATVTLFLDEIGYDAYDTGSIADSWRFERDRPAYVGVYGGFDFSEPGTPADAAKLQELLDAAQR